MPKEPNFCRVSIPKMAGTFRFWITSRRTLCLTTCPISMLVTISPKQRKEFPLAAAGTLYGGLSCHFSMPGSLELIQVTSEPVSNSQVHFTFPIFPATCRVDLRCDQGHCGTIEALFVELDTSGGLTALVLFSLNVARNTDWPHDPYLHN